MRRPGLRGFHRRAMAAGGALSPSCFTRGVASGCGAASTRGAAGLTGQCRGRCGGSPLVLEGPANCPRTRGGGLAVRRGLLQIVFGLFARAGARASDCRRRQLHAGAARLRQPDGDGLLRRSRAVLAFTDVVELLWYEFTGLSGRGLAFPLVLSGLPDWFLFRHVSPSLSMGKVCM